MKIVQVLLTFVIILLVLLTRLFSPPIEVHKFGQGNGPTICLIGSVHGNEEAGTHALYDMIRNKSNNLNAFKGTIYIIPNPNPLGIQYHTRYAYSTNKGWYDLNRQYNNPHNEKNPVIQTILEYVHKSDLVLEFHEGYYFHSLDPSSLGSTISPTNLVSNETIDAMEYAINQFIHEPHKKFQILRDDDCAIPTTLSCYCRKNKIPYVLIEISGQNNIQPLPLRMEQVKTLALTALDSQNT